MIDIKCAYSKLESVHKLVPHPRNDNQHKAEHANLLAKVMKARGVRHPIIVSKNSGFIVAGHLRLMAAKELGLDEYPVDVQEFENEAEEYAFLSSDNNVARYAEFDEEKFKKNLIDLNIDIQETDLEEFGLLDFELPGIENLEPQCDEDEVPEAPPVPITKRGDVWILGNHRVMCGDSTMIDDVEKLMSGEKAALTHTDPPYNIGYEGGSKKREKIENDKLDNFNEFLAEVYANINTVMWPGACIYVWHAAMETHNFIAEFLKAGFLYKSYIVWNKNNSTFGRSDYHWKHEPAVYGWKDGGAHKWFGDRKQTTVWDIERPSRSDEHPTMKPVKLCEKAIENSSGPGAIVLDVFLGSGSTLIACENLNRRCFGMELGEHYCDVIVERYMKYTGKDDVYLESTGEKFSNLKEAQDV